MPSLADGEIDVWHATPGQVDDRHRGLLSPVERERHDALLRQQDRDRFATGAALLRLAAASYLDQDPHDLAVDRACAHCGGPHGKPRVAGLELSVTHSGDRVLLAAARRTPVGVDVEAAASRVDLDRMLDHVLTPAETGVVRAMPRADQVTGFLRYWVRKEAVVKATGDGLQAPMTALHVSAPGEPARLVGWVGRPEAHRTIQLVDVEVGPEHLGALAVIGPPGQRVSHRDAATLLAAVPGR